MPFVWAPLFSSLGHVVRSGVAGSEGNSMFSLLRNHRTVPTAVVGFLHFPEQCTRDSTSPHTQLLEFFSLFNYSHPRVCEMTSHYGFDLHSQMTNDVQHLFMHLLVICMSSLEKSLSSLPMFKMELSFMCCVFTFSPPSLLLPPLPWELTPRGPTQ